MGGGGGVGGGGGGGRPYVRWGNKQFGKCLLMKTIYKYCRLCNKIIAAKTIPGSRNKLQECKQNFQVLCDNSKLLTGVLEIGSARGTN